MRNVTAATRANPNAAQASTTTVKAHATQNPRNFSIVDGAGCEQLLAVDAGNRELSPAMLEVIAQPCRFPACTAKKGPTAE